MEKASEKPADWLVPVLHRHCWRVWACLVTGGPGCFDGRRCRRSLGSSPRLKSQGLTLPTEASHWATQSLYVLILERQMGKKGSTSQEAVVHQLRKWSRDCCVNLTLLTNAHHYYFIKAVVRAGVLVSLQNLPPPVNVFLAVPEFLWTEKPSFCCCSLLVYTFWKRKHLPEGIIHQSNPDWNTRGFSNVFFF